MFLSRRAVQHVTRPHALSALLHTTNTRRVLCMTPTPPTALFQYSKAHYCTNNNNSSNNNSNNNSIQPPVESSAGDDDEEVVAPQEEDGGQYIRSAGSGVDAKATTQGVDEVDVVLEPCDNPPTKYEVYSGTKVFKWTTTAKYGRRLIGPMHEWSDELKYRTGVSVHWEPTFPEKIFLRSYSHRDDVDVTVYFFGSERAITGSLPFIKQMAAQQPVYVRCGVFQRQGEGQPPLWLTLRRVNNDTRPPDIPPISLKTPGKWTLLFETKKEAAVRTLYEETGLRIDESMITPTGMLDTMDVEYFWRVPVYYFIAELPEGAEVMGPRTALGDYFMDWDPKILRQSPDPIDRTWATHGDPKTGCAWLPGSKIDELQMPLKGEKYMATRYTPGEHLKDLRAATQLF